ncbi:YciI family protein [Anderseniella sp. Alg231-50]|uniref:YciI family protein n=1 Tax=Anderseniella sp. Alg231-50 TaxID=1922226 RepID=UPI000D54DB3C
MPQFIFAYHGGKMPEDPYEGAKLMARWEAWMAGLGKAVVNPGHPVGKSSTVTSSGVTDDGGSNPLSGFSLVEADSMDAAIEMARGCPHIEHGSIEIAETMAM